MTAGEGTAQSAPDAREVLSDLVGTTVRTLAQDKPNQIVEIKGSDVIVATDRSPGGDAIPIKSIQDALDSLYADGELLVDKRVVGYRSAFIGAVLRELPNVSFSTHPRRVWLTEARTT